MNPEASGRAVATETTTDPARRGTDGPGHQQPPNGRDGHHQTHDTTPTAGHDTTPTGGGAAAGDRVADTVDRPAGTPHGRTDSEQPVTTHGRGDDLRDRSTATRATGTRDTDDDQPHQLLDSDQVQRFRSRWTELQSSFVDEPGRAVQQADELVAEVMRTVTERFTAHKKELDGPWRGEGAAETEELRVALRRYRSFFDQLVKA